MRHTSLAGIVSIAGLATGSSAIADGRLTTQFGITLQLVSTDCPGCGGGPLLATAFGWANEATISPEGVNQQIISVQVDTTAEPCESAQVLLAYESGCPVAFSASVGPAGSNALVSAEVTSSICYTCETPVSMALESSIARAQLILNNGELCDIEVIPGFQLSLENEACTSVAPVSYGVHRSLAVIRHNGTTVWSGLMLNSTNGSSTLNLINDGGGEFSASIASFTATGTLDVYTAGFSDRTHDANGDGRFNPSDTVEVDSWVGLTGVPAVVLAAADLNGNGTIEQSEADILQLLIDAGGGSGRFGDLDGDGDTDCTDFSNGDGAWGDSLGDAGYRLELDFNLDGFLGQDDRAAFYRTVGHADFNLDGFVDFFDFDEYVTAFENDDPSAEWTLDGFLDFFDYDGFVSAFENGC